MSECPSRPRNRGLENVPVRLLVAGVAVGLSLGWNPLIYGPVPPLRWSTAAPVVWNPGWRHARRAVERRREPARPPGVHGLAGRPDGDDLLHPGCAGSQRAGRTGRRHIGELPGDPRAGQRPEPDHLRQRPRHLPPDRQVGERARLRRRAAHERDPDHEGLCRAAGRVDRRRHDRHPRDHGRAVRRHHGPRVRALQRPRPHFGEPRPMARRRHGCLPQTGPGPARDDEPVRALRRRDPAQRRHHRGSRPSTRPRTS